MCSVCMFANTHDMYYLFVWNHDGLPWSLPSILALNIYTPFRNRIWLQAKNRSQFSMLQNVIHTHTHKPDNICCVCCHFSAFCRYFCCCFFALSVSIDSTTVKLKLYCHKYHYRRHHHSVCSCDY